MEILLLLLKIEFYLELSFLKITNNEIIKFLRKLKKKKKKKKIYFYLI